MVGQEVPVDGAVIPTGWLAEDRDVETAPSTVCPPHPRPRPTASLTPARASRATIPGASTVTHTVHSTY